MTCPKCGVVAEAGTRFCGNCGGPLTSPAQGIQAKPTRVVHEGDIHATELPAHPVHARETQYVPPEVVPHPGGIHAKPTTMGIPEAAAVSAPANLLKAPPTARASELSQAVQASVHALVPPVSQPQAQYSEPRVPVNMVSNLTGPPPAAAAEPLYSEVEAHIKAVAIWFQLYGGVAMVVSLFLFNSDPVMGAAGLGVGIAFLVTGFMLFQCTPLGRIMALLMAAITLCACGYGALNREAFPIGIWAVPWVFAIMTLILLTAGNASQVCTARYQHRSRDAQHETLNLGSAYFWAPGALTGIVLVLQGWPH